MPILKAFNGNRSKNLLEIAKEIRHLLSKEIGITEKHRILGYCSQLEIIGDELKKAAK